MRQRYISARELSPFRGAKDHGYAAKDLAPTSGVLPEEAVSPRQRRVVELEAVTGNKRKGRHFGGPFIFIGVKRPGSPHRRS